MLKNQILQRQFTVNKEKIEKLSPRQFQVQNQENDYFTCKICMKVVLEPQECEKCQNSYCKDCINQWQKQNKYMCPLLCNNPTYGDIRNFAQNRLKAKKFKCINKECDSSNMDYNKALDHQQVCEYNKYNCEFKCGEKFIGKDLHQHIKQCKNAFIVCEKCEQKDYFNVKKHDCIQALQDCLSNPINIMEIKQDKKCPDGHNLQRLFKKPRSYKGNARCDECRGRYLQKHQYFYHCTECKYDQCRACNLCPEILQKEDLHVSIHQCPLQYDLNDNRFICHGSQQNAKCYSGLDKDTYSQYIQNWFCQNCDFRLCLNCCLVYAENK